MNSNTCVLYWLPDSIARKMNKSRVNDGPIEAKPISYEISKPEIGLIVSNFEHQPHRLPYAWYFSPIVAHFIIINSY